MPGPTTAFPGAGVKGGLEGEQGVWMAGNSWAEREESNEEAGGRERGE